MRILIIAVPILFSGCGLYVHTGGGGYTFIGPGSMGVANRCSNYAQDTTWRFGRYDYDHYGKKP